MTHKFSVNQEVVRTKGDYVVGRTGTVVAVDEIKSRAQVQWNGETKTWVSFTVIAPTSIPFEIRLKEIRKGYTLPRYYELNP